MYKNSYLKTKVLKPLGMHSSFIHTTDYKVSNDEAIGYRWNGEQRKHVPDDIFNLLPNQMKLCDNPK